MSISVSVIIPAHNAARFIEPCLRAALASAEAHDWEILVVDDGSTDETSRLAESFGVRTVRHEQSQGAAAARNHGARISKGDILVFLDSDVVVPEDTLPKLVNRLRESPEIHATGAHASPRNLSPSWSAHFVALRHSHAFYCQQMHDIVGVSCFQSECGAVRREAFEGAGGFPEKYSHAGMEDYAFGHEMERLGYVNVLLADAAYDHHYRSLWPRCREVMRRSARWLPLVFRRRRFESQGMGASSRDSISFLISVAILVGISTALFHPIGWYLGGIAAVGQIVWELPFLRFARQQYGVKMALYAWPALQVFHGAIFVGFACGALRIVGMMFEPRRSDAKGLETG
ncbi:MAG: glycosyltransferase family 2 protein [Planctomycetota bacterium]|nr:glycosyltransferase family 2 protein [Planctomycetota bacterium]